MTAEEHPKGFLAGDHLPPDPNEPMWMDWSNPKGPVFHRHVEPEFPRWDWIVVVAYICAIIFCIGVFYGLAELIVSVT